MSRLHITSATELTIDLGDGRRFAVHPLWLRERCLDPETFDLRTGQRLGDPSDLDLNLTLSAVSEPNRGESGCGSVTATLMIFWRTIFWRRRLSRRGRTTFRRHACGTGRSPVFRARNGVRSRATRSWRGG